MDVEILLCDDYPARADRMMRAMIAAVPSDVRATVTTSWRRQARVLMTYGLGHEERKKWTAEHQLQGGTVVGWDLGYWNRQKQPDPCMRVTINADHPYAMIQPEPPERFAAEGIELREDHNPDGPIILCGLGVKQRQWKGYSRWQWEDGALRRLRKRYGERRILYRPKRPEDAPGGLETAHGTIEDVLRGASLLVCHHSNVAVDACIAGVPVQCDDGAALALYRGNQSPTHEQRLAFLQSLAWWQYRTAEAALAWEFIQRKLA